MVDFIIIMLFYCTKKEWKGALDTNDGEGECEKRQITCQRVHSLTNYLKSNIEYK